MGSNSLCVSCPFVYNSIVLPINIVCCVLICRINPSIFARSRCVLASRAASCEAFSSPRWTESQRFIIAPPVSDAIPVSCRHFLTNRFPLYQRRSIPSRYDMQISFHAEMLWDRKYRLFSSFCQQSVVYQSMGETNRQI